MTDGVVPPPMDPRPPRHRLAAIDAVRGGAILAMIVYHFAWDLHYFGLFGVDVGTQFVWRWFSHLIAGTFLGLVGLSLALATGQGLRLRPYLRRLGLIIAAAFAVSAVTYAVSAADFVYFGILDAIALASVVALPFLGLPWPIVLASAAVAFAAPLLFASPFFNAPFWWWLGLSTLVRESVDYVPLLPWFGATLLGILAGRMALRSARAGAGWAHWMPQRLPGAALVMAGRWSLVIYLLHQPVLYAIAFLLGMAFPAGPEEARLAAFRTSCVATCTQRGRTGPDCAAYCGCVEREFRQGGLLDEVIRDRVPPEHRPLIVGMAGRCTTNLATPVPEKPMPLDSN